MAIVALVLVCAGGCAAPGAVTATGPYQPMEESHRNTLEAQRLTAQASACLSIDPRRAEQLLRQALTADLYYGPAHNNLGVLYLRSDPPRLYESASELEWACKLMPGHPDPRMNLAMTLEAAGRSDDAIASYRAAIETYPGYIPAVQALTSLQLRRDRPDDSIETNLKEIAMRGTTQQWQQWARAQLMSRAK